jgi:PTH1 family peptidyl-tRNA hydrolase
MIVFLALGNPSPFEETRHNLGKYVLECFREKNKDKFSNFIYSPSLKSRVAQQKKGKQKIVLALSESFMNHSHLPALKIKKFFKLKTGQLWLIYDDLDLPLGKIRIRLSGSAGGHKGVEAIIRAFKTKNLPRIRLGIKSNEFSKTKGAARFVLEKFTPLEKKILTKTIEQTERAINLITSGKVAQAMTLFNR